MKINILLAVMMGLILSCQSNQVRFPNQTSNPVQQVDNKIDFEFIHTQQDCKVPNETMPGTFHKKTFCANINNGDLQSTTELSGMVKKAQEILDTALLDPKNAKLSVAYFSFSNKGIQRKFCELSSKGVQIRVFLDGGSVGQIDDLVMNNAACKDAQGKLNVKLSYLGGNTNPEAGSGAIWQLHHNKFLMLEVPNQKVRLNFSSGNLSSFGTSLHLDHWVMLTVPVNTNLVRAHQCVMQGLESASVKAKEENVKPAAIGQAYIEEREKCFDLKNVTPRQSLINTTTDTSNQIQANLAVEEIAPLFSPNNNKYTEKSFIAALDKVPKGGYIYIAIQHFLHPGVSNALTSAAGRGVDVRIVMDDDALRGESEVPGVDAMIKKLLLIKGIQVRFAETNHSAGGNGQMMHNKFAIINGDMTFSGAGHYTNAAFNVNWENFYFAKNKKIILGYSQYFSELWAESVDSVYTISKGSKASAPPSALGSKFLKSIQ